MQTQLAAIDTSTRAGALAAQTINQQRELAQEMHAGGQARYALEAKHRLELSNLNREWDQRELKEAQQKREQLNALIRGYTDRFYGVVTDTSTLEGALKEHDRKAARERLDAVDQSAEAMAYLELTLGVERLAIQKRFVDAAVEEERRLAKERIDASNSAVSGIANWLRGMVTGTTAGYSPQTRLQAAAATYDAMIAQARTGSLEAANQLTTAADALLDAARGFYGSSQGYQQIRSLIISDISHLGPVVTSTDPVVQAVLNVVDAVQSSTNAINTVNTSVGGVNTSVGGVNTSVGAVNTATGLVKSTLIDTNSAIGTTNTKIGDDTTNTKNIAGRQEAEYFNSTEESTGLAAERAKQQVDLGNQQVSIQNKMLDALNEIIRLDGVIAKTGATAIVAPTTTTVDPTLEATKAANRKRYNDDVALRNAWLNGTPGTYFYNYALSWVINPANYQPMASGGRVSGPGGPVDDLVHTRLSNTEGVLPGAAMKRLDDTYGRSVFDNFLMQGRLPSIPAVSTAGNDNILMAGFLALGRKVDQLSDGLDRVVRATAVGSMHVREGVDNMATATTVLVQEQKLARAS
jgi:hypothetical protein